jgi:hypothetical protein
MVNDLDVLEGRPYNELLTIYRDNFSLGYFNTDINNKFALIALISHITYKAREKKPDVTHYSIIRSITKDMSIPHSMEKRLAVLCDDFSYGCTSFPTFGLKGQDIIIKIKEILSSYVPF